MAKGTAIWKTQVWFMLLVIIFLLAYIGTWVFQKKHKNYQELWKKVSELEMRCQWQN